MKTKSSRISLKKIDVKLVIDCSFFEKSLDISSLVF